MIKPYYQDDAVTIFHGDCREILPQLEPVDLVLTDPPYGIGFVQKTNDFHGSKFFDNGKSLRASVLYDDSADHVLSLISFVMPEIFRLSKRAIVFCGQANLWNYPEPSAIGCVFLSNGAGRCSWGFQGFIPMLFYGPDPYLENGLGARPNSFRTEQPNKEHFDHPAPKPIRWMKWAVNRGSLSGNILDPFMGSGTTLRAAKDLGRKAIGIEIEEKYCEIAAKRMSQEVLNFGGMDRAHGGE